jgi:hypothetical protein
MLHLFVCSGRFGSFAEMRSFVDPTYTDDGVMVPSMFMREVQLEAFEPNCIEVFWTPQPRPLVELVCGVSWADQWLPQINRSLLASEAVCVFAPNRLGDPMGTPLIYCGAYRYKPELPSS